MIAIGTKTMYGKVAAIGSMSGERYYWLIKAGAVSMMPAVAVEPLEAGPDGYIAKMNWLEWMSKRYEQLECNRCALWAVWKRKAKRASVLETE